LVTQAPKDQLGRYNIADVPYAQYARGEVDFRNYYSWNKSNTLAVRALMGLGLPYGNSFVMPFEKSFSAGGANDIRGWIARRIGPGAYNPTNGIRSVDQFADVKLLFSLEYRLKVIKQIEIALFADAGNVWLLRNDNDRPQGNFDFKRFYKEFALSTGFGIRLNLGYFVFRLDPSVPLYDPTQNSGEKWVVNKLTLKRVIWNLAIGFPF
jgi:outer membrane protein assembly factor BamA